MATSAHLPIRNHVDCALLGNDPALLLVACLLARKGLRIVLFTDAPATFPWLAGGPLLQRYCQRLGLTLPLLPQPLQLITSQTRLELGGERPLTEELQRELPADAKVLLDWLERLQALGSQLHRLLERVPPPIGGWRNRLGFHWTLRLNLPARALARPAAASLPPLSAEAQLTVRTLLEGLALAPLQHLNTAEAALLLHAQLAGQEPDGPALTALMRQRLQQFHGREESLAQVQGLARDGQHWRLETAQGALRASRLVLGRIDTHPAGCPPLSLRLPQSWRVQPGQPLPAPMGRRLLLAGEPSLRLEVVRHGADPVLHVSGSPDPAGQAIDPTARLAELFPFGDLSVEPEAAATTWLRRPGLFSRGPMRLQPAPGLLTLHGPSLLPHLAGQAELLAVAGLLALFDHQPTANGR